MRGEYNRSCNKGDANKKKITCCRILLVLSVFLRGCRTKRKLKIKQITKGFASYEGEAQPKQNETQRIFFGFLELAMRVRPE